MLTSGKVAYEIGANVDATCFGGIAAVHRLVTKLGLVDQIDKGLHLLKVHLPYHESDHVLNLAYNVVCGGTRLEDIERLRHDTAYMNALGADLIPDPTTAGDFCRRFGEHDVVELMERINAVRPQLWTGRGRDLLGPIAYIDADGTIAPTSGRRKAGMDMSYKGIWGYAPLIVSLANTKEVLYLVNRPGNAPSHQDAAVWIDKAIDLVVPHTQRVCLRGDTDFSLTAHFDLHRRVAIGRPDHLVGNAFDFLLHFIEFASHEAFYGVNRIPRIGDGLAFGGIADQTFTRFRKSNDRRGRPFALGVLQNFGLATLHHRHTTIGCS